MKARHLILFLVIASSIIASGCAKRIPISYDQAQSNATVKIETISGQTWKGVILEKNLDYLLLKPHQSGTRLAKIRREEISSITGRELVYDGNGNIISEFEIQEKKNNKNLLLYTIGGTGLSFGASLFIGSLIHRSLDDTEKGNNFLWGTTALGTTTGIFLFAKAGKRRDRHFAIEAIREQRFNAVKDQFENNKKKHSSIQQQLEKEKAERARQEQELKQLQEKVKTNKKK